MRSQRAMPKPGSPRSLARGGSTPTRSPLYVIQASVQAADQDEEGAEATLRAAVAQAPYDGRALANLGSWLRGRDDSEALGLLLRAARVSQENLKKGLTDLSPDDHDRLLRGWELLQEHVADSNANEGEDRFVVLMREQLISARKLFRQLERAGEERPMWMRHSQGDQWDLMIIYPIGSMGEYFSDGRLGARGRLARQRATMDQITGWREELFVNGPALPLIRDAGDTLVGVLKKMTDSQTVVETAVWNVLSRAPADDERKILVEFYARHGDDRLKASQQLVWSLLTSSELRFNY